MFIGPNAVAEAIAAKFGVDKGELLAPDADGMAVRLALGEAQIVRETREFLEREGVCVDAFNEKTWQRSKTVILVKNLPFGTQAVELRALFSAYGSLGRVVMPPTGTVALVELIAPQEARAAFRALAYTKFKYLPLYLEWAPMETFRDKPPTQAPPEPPAAHHAANEANPIVPAMDADVVATDDGTVGAARTTLFVKNLNFSTTEQTLRRVFEAAGALKSVRIVRRRDPRHEGVQLSMGFGFVEYCDREGAERALKTLAGVVVDKHALQLRPSVRTASDAATRAKVRAGGRVSTEPVQVTGTKLLVRNVAFEAAKREIRELFRPFGQVKSLRLPRKFDGTHRGFAFVEMLSKEQAKMAFQALSNTHFYGRHLVLEWTKDDQVRRRKGARVAVAMCA